MNFTETFSPLFRLFFFCHIFTLDRGSWCLHLFAANSDLLIGFVPLASVQTRAFFRGHAVSLVTENQQIMGGSMHFIDAYIHRQTHTYMKPAYEFTQSSSPLYHAYNAIVRQSATTWELVRYINNKEGFPELTPKNLKKFLHSKILAHGVSFHLRFKFFSTPKC